MKDIAEQLGVSISTVSLALAGHPRIPEATRTQVVLLAHKLGYKLPHERRNTALCLAIILTDPASPMGCLYHEAISGIINEAMASGAILQIMQPPPPRAGGRSQLLNLLRKNGATGLFSSAVASHRPSSRLLSNRIIPSSAWASGSCRRPKSAGWPPITWKVPGKPSAT